MTTTNQHLITPPPELVQQWMNEICDDPDGDPHFVSSDDRALATRAAQWGADQELEACCEWFQEFYRTESWVTHDLKNFRAARRPKPPSLKEQALDELAYVYERDKIDDTTYDTIRRALEALPDD
jgi:hypothetical protein